MEKTNEKSRTQDLTDFMSGRLEKKSEQPRGGKTEKSVNPVAASSGFEPLHKSSFELPRSQYEKVQEVARRNGLSYKQLFTAIVDSFISEYERSHGPITLRESKISLNELV